VEQTVSKINYHIEELLKQENLSERTKNVCLDEGIETLFKIIAFYFKNGDFKIIRNCGEKTNKELIGLSQKYIALYTLTPDMLGKTDEETPFDKFKFFCFDRFNIPSDVMESLKVEFIDSRLPFFKFINILTNNILNERELFIFESNSGFYKGKKKQTLQLIGSQYSITRERVRQISQRIPLMLESSLLRLFDHIKFIKNHFYYNLEEKEDYIIVSPRFSDAINQVENLEYTTRFYGFVFSLIYKDSHKLYFNSKHYKNCYLIKNEFAALFDFNKFYKDIETRIHTRNAANYLLNIADFIPNFLKTQDADIIAKLLPLCKRIATDEFGLTLEENSSVVVPRNTMKKLSEFVIEILEDFKHPMHLTEIRQELDRRTIKSPPNIESLRSSILSIGDIVAIGKTSTYALKGWGYVKTGTIKKLVFEYLNQFNEPKHINEISEFVNQFRVTNDKNILSNLKLDKNNIFIFFKQGYVGISNKNYKLENTNLV